MKLILSMLFMAIVGIVAGTVGAFYGTYYACAYIDQVQGAELGSGLTSVGWIFWLITVPLGAILRGVGSPLLTYFLFFRRRKSGSS